MREHERNRDRRTRNATPATYPCGRCGEPMRYERVGDVFVHAITGGVVCDDNRTLHHVGEALDVIREQLHLKGGDE